MNMKITGIIPARYGSTRFPGKPLALLDGRPMLLHVFEHASESRLLTGLFAATESPNIKEACESLSIPCLMTDPSHENPTSRLREAAASIPSDLYVMIGGDEPLLTGEDIDLVVQAALDRMEREDELFVVNAMAPVLSPSEAMDTANIKVVCGEDGRGLYTSRIPIPYPKGELNFTYQKFASIGVYTRKALDFFADTPKGPLETIEECDLLRFLEHNVPVYFVNTGHPSLSVDTKKDLRQVRLMAEQLNTINGGLSCTKELSSI